MARRPRIEVAGGIYHVYNRVASGESIFSDPDEATTFLEIVREIKRRDGWTLFASCLLSIHFHLVMRTATVPLMTEVTGRSPPTKKMSGSVPFKFLTSDPRPSIRHPQSTRPRVSWH